MALNSEDLHQLEKLCIWSADKRLCTLVCSHVSVQQQRKKTVVHSYLLVSLFRTRDSDNE